MEEYLFLKHTDNGYSFCKKDEAEFAMMSIKEFNGFINTLNIINHRALQQIDKSETDEYGFRLLRADIRYYRKGKGDLILITKETPFSVKLSLQEVSFFIKKELFKIYKYINVVDLTDFSDELLNSKKISPEEITKAVKNRNEHEDKCNFFVQNNAKGRAIYKAFHEYKDFIVEIDRIVPNYGKGLYEVSYWATNFI